ncbi:MAG: 16S rRNA (cytidine(1402)-2'-O)-methyltransferase [Deltaproteobacteria bacterium]|nr:16S rRNA (cytidine(1402)-2'-O)-methyltransferase [Deltaproteobacteria bacterium]
MAKLYIVSTPIGNLEDITLRALRILKEVDLIAAEDTRHTKKLLNHYNIKTPLTSYFEHNELTKGEFIISKIKEGRDAALVSDAGTPGISDPGYRLIKMAIENNIDVSPIPGASAIIASLSASGLPTDSFAFYGFLPAKQGEVERLLLKIKSEKRTAVFYESPRRLLKTLEAVLKICGDIDIVIAREITKVYEEFLRGKVSEVLGKIKGREVKGEIAIILSNFLKEKIEGKTIEDDIRYYLKELGLPLKETAQIIAKEWGIPKREVYKIGLKIKEEG